MKIVLSIGLLAAVAAGFQDPPARLKAAVETTRAQKSYLARFQATVRIPDSDPLEIKGRLLWVRPGALFLEYESSGGGRSHFLRAGDRVWYFHPQFEEWVPSEEVNKGGAARGIQNPDEMLPELLKVADRAAAEGREIALRLDGEDLKKILRGYEREFDWKESTARARLGIDEATGRMKSILLEAEVRSSDPGIKGKGLYTGKVDVESYNELFFLTFTQPSGPPNAPREVPVPLAPELLEALGKLKDPPEEFRKELKQRGQR